jgi:hypothetical protein
VFGTRWIPGIDVDRAKLRATLSYRFSTRFSAGIEVNPLASDVGPIANWLAIPEEDDTPALILGTSSDRIGTTHGRAVYATLSKDLEKWTGLSIAPYAGVSYGTFDDEAVAIGGLAINWSARISSIHSWDGHNLQNLVETSLGESQLIGLVLTHVDGEYDLGVTWSIGF